MVATDAVIPIETSGLPDLLPIELAVKIREKVPDRDLVFEMICDS